MAKDTAPSDSTASPAALVYTLAEPALNGAATITQLPYRKATGRDIRKALNIGRSGDRYMTMMVDLFEMPETFFNGISGPDFMAITDLVDGFFARPQAT